MKLSDKDLKDIRELGKFAIREIIGNYAESLSIKIIDVDIRPNGLFSILTKDLKEVRISFKESKDRTFDNIWVGVCTKDYKRLAEKPHNSFILLADMKLGHLIVIPFNIVKWHNFSYGKSFTIYVKGEQYWLGKGIKPIVDNLEPVFSKLI